MTLRMIFIRYYAGHQKRSVAFTDSAPIMSVQTRAI